MTEINYQKIADLDPLQIDPDIAELPSLNTRNNTEAITRLGAKMVTAVDDMALASLEEAYASLRDLDFVASSLGRHGVNPFTAVDGLELAMIQMGEAAGSVPRSTITTYAGANPSGERRRTFTGSNEETIFLDSLKNSFDELEIAYNGIGNLRSDSHNSEIDKVLQVSSQSMQIMVDSMIGVKKMISPEYFTGQMRPYFDPLLLDGNMYSAAGGGQLQLVGIERMVYGTKRQDLIDYKFFAENYAYFNASQRERLNQFIDGTDDQTVLSIVEHRHVQGIDMEETLTALSGLTRMIRKFRYPHRKVAADNFKLRPDGSVGSGSHTPLVLTELINETEERMAYIGALQCK